MSSLRSVSYAILAFIPMLGTAAVACFFEALSYIVVRPASLSKHRQLCVYFTRCFFLSSNFLLEQWSAITFRSYGSRIDPKKSYLTLVNHRSDVDWLLGLAYVSHLGTPYPGNAKSVVKASLGKVPVFGSILRFAEFLFLTRNWAQDRKQFLNALTSLRSFGKCGRPLWFVLYPEGTRFTEDKREISRAYATAKNHQPHDNVLFPRFKAFTAIVSALRDDLDGIIDATFMFEGAQPTLKATLGRSASATVHVHTKSYSMKDIPEGEEQLEKWLLDRWYEKDALISEFIKDPRALGPPDSDFFPDKNTPSLTPFYAMVGIFLVSSAAMIYCLSKIRNGLAVLFGSSIIAVLMTAIFVMFNLKPSRKGTGSVRTRR